MSWDVEVMDPETNEVLVIPKHGLRGGTFSLEGTDNAWLNITYNYGKFYHHALKTVDVVVGLGCLDGLTVAEAVPVVAQALATIGTVERAENYWAATPGNAGAALLDLLVMLRECPVTAKVQVS